MMLYCDYHSYAKGVTKAVLFPRKNTDNVNANDLGYVHSERKRM